MEKMKETKNVLPLLLGLDLMPRTGIKKGISNSLERNSDLWEPPSYTSWEFDLAVISLEIRYSLRSIRYYFLDSFIKMARYIIY